MLSCEAVSINFILCVGVWLLIDLHNSVKLLSLKDICLCPVLSSYWCTLFSFTEFGISILIPNYIPSPLHRFHEPDLSICSARCSQATFITCAGWRMYYLGRFDTDIERLTCRFTNFEITSIFTYFLYIYIYIYIYIYTMKLDPAKCFHNFVGGWPILFIGRILPAFSR